MLFPCGSDRFAIKLLLVLFLSPLRERVRVRVWLRDVGPRRAHCCLRIHNLIRGKRPQNTFAGARLLMRYLYIFIIRAGSFLCTKSVLISFRLR